MANLLKKPLSVHSCTQDIQTKKKDISNGIEGLKIKIQFVIELCWPGMIISVTWR